MSAIRFALPLLISKVSSSEADRVTVAELATGGSPAFQLRTDAFGFGASDGQTVRKPPLAVTSTAVRLSTTEVASVGTPQVPVPMRIDAVYAALPASGVLRGPIGAPLRVSSTRHGTTETKLAGVEVEAARATATEPAPTDTATVAPTAAHRDRIIEFDNICRVFITRSVLPKRHYVSKKIVPRRGHSHLKAFAQPLFAAN
jgi:hypothetical protein